MRTLIGVTLCTFLLLGGCSKSDDDTKTSEMTSDAVDTAMTEGSDAIDATQQGEEAAASIASDAQDAAKAAGNDAIDQASDMAAVEAEKAANDATEAANDSTSKAVEDASEMINK